MLNLNSNEELNKNEGGEENKEGVGRTNRGGERENINLSKFRINSNDKFEQEKFVFV